MRLTLCLLTWNEIEGCRLDVPRLPVNAFEEVYAIDGGSKDGTIEYLESLHVPVHAQDGPGYNNAYISAFRRCTTDAVVFFHPKGAVDPAETLKFRPLLDQGFDLVVASRIGNGAVNEEDAYWLKPRKWFVMSLALLAAALWKREGNMIWDVLQGFRAMRKEAFSLIQPLPYGLSMDIEMVARSYRKRLKRVAFPTKEVARPHGETHFKAWPTGKKLVKYLWSELRRKD